MATDRRVRRHMSIRRRTAGTTQRPRLCVKRSNNCIYAMLVDDTQHRVLTGVSSLVAEIREKKLKRTDAAREVGKLMAAKAKGMGVSKVVFDRAGYQYHGRVKAVADGAREGGLQF